MTVRARIIETGAAVPDRIVGNEELARLTGISAGSIRRRTGILERRWAAAGGAPAGLPNPAGLPGVEWAGEHPGDLAALILSPTAPAHPLPGSGRHVSRLP